jgi:tight adherence protein C
MSALPAVAVVALGVAGLVLVVQALPIFRRPALGDRLAPYLGALGPRGSRLLDDVAAPRRGLAVVLGPIASDVAARLHDVLGSIDIDARVAASGWPCSVRDFRMSEVSWGIGGLAAGLASCALLAAGGRAISPVAALVMALVFAAGSVLWRERALDRAVAARRAAMLAEFPTTVDLVCLAVTAGESLRGALDIVARTGGGPLAFELRAVLRAARAGEPLADALGVAARRIDLAPFDRFVDAVVAAQQRGLPLADALHALAGDVRESRKRDVLEAAGRKQVAMLIPVVALVLPVAVVFAFYPGVIALRMVTR